MISSKKSFKSARQTAFLPFLITSAVIHLFILILLSIIKPSYTADNAAYSGRLFVDLVHGSARHMVSPDQGSGTLKPMPREMVPLADVQEPPSEMDEKEIVGAETPVSDSDEATADRPGETAEHKGASGAGPSDARGERGEAQMQMAPPQSKYQQLLFMKNHHFYRATSFLVRLVLRETIDIETRSKLEGETATVELGYNDAGEIVETAVSATSQELNDLLSHKVDWKRISPPSAYSLPYKKLSVTIRVKDDLLFVAVNNATY